MDTKSTNDKDAGLALLLILLIIIIITHNSKLLLPVTALLVVAMTAPVLFRPFSIVWFGLSAILGNFSSAIVLTTLFIVLIVPISYLRRISSSDTLQLRKWKKNGESAFSVKEHKYRAADMDNPF